MYIRNLVAQPLLAPEDAGSAGASTADGPAGGSQPQEGNADVDVPDAGEPRVGTGPADGDDDDVLVADEDFSDTPFHQHPRFKAVTSKLKKLAKQNQRLRSTTERYKGVDLDSLKSDAGVAAQFRDLLSRNPALHKQVLTALAAGNQPTADADDINPNDLPFDVSDDVGKYFVAQAKTLRQLTKEVEAFKRAQATNAQASYEQEWKKATLAARAELPDNVQEMFQDAMYGAYRIADWDGKRVNPQTFIRQYLGKLREKGWITAAAAARSTAASAQRIAENNKQLPRQPAGGGQPASSRPKGETVTDVNRRLKHLWRSA